MLNLDVQMQMEFGWSESHPYEFRNEDGSITIGMDFGELGIDQKGAMLNEEATSLLAFIPRLSHFEYLYDFGYSWRHIIQVGYTQNVDGRPFARCTGGRGVTPVEDCGGASGYEALCEILKDPSHEEYEKVSAWLGDDVPFDRASINEELGKLKFVPYHPKRRSKTL